MQEIDPRFQELNSEIRECRRCRLAETRIHALCGEGDSESCIMLVAQAPGDNEDREDRMFIGPSGQVLDSLLSTAEISRDDIYMTNLLKCRLPDYRQPKQDEIDACHGFLDRAVDLVNPKVKVSLGYYATRYFLRSLELPFSVARSRVANLFDTILPIGKRQLYPVPHPAAVLYHEEYWPDTRALYLKLPEFL